MMSGDGFSSPPSSLTSFIHEPIGNPNPNSSISGKRKRNQAGNPDPEAEVIALSPASLMATNRFVCEICNKGFQRDQNLQLHRRGHNLPWKLKQRNKNEVMKKKVYICPEKTCVHHDPSRALGDLTGVKKHYSRKHGEKKWKCEKCSKKYAVQSDWKAHSKICGTREYKCDCGTLFSRKDSFITHRAFCDALMEENSRMASLPMVPNMANLGFRNDLMMMNTGGGGGGGGTGGGDEQFQPVFGGGLENNLDINGAKPRLPMWLDHNATNPHLENPNGSSFMGSSSSSQYNNGGMLPPDMVNWVGRFNGLPQGMSLKDDEQAQKQMQLNSMFTYGGSTPQNSLMCSSLPPVSPAPASNMSATALLQKAAQMGSTRSTTSGISGGDTGFGLMTSALSNLSSPRAGDRLMTIPGLSQPVTAPAPAPDGPSPGKMSGGGEFGDSDLTRDFLGVARNERNVSFNLQQEFNKFASSSMGFNQFNRSHE